jgi:hypothetical protein
MDTINIFTEDTDLNIVKSWLCNATDGQTYPFDRFAKRITCPQAQYRFDEIEGLWDERIGHKHDYKVDDPAMQVEAEETLKRLNDFIDDVNANPEKYLKEAFDNNDGKAYVCIEETPDLGKEVICVKHTADAAREWVESKRKTSVISSADWRKTASPDEYSIIDLNAPYGWYAFRRDCDLRGKETRT